jgi:hypothetical protein
MKWSQPDDFPKETGEQLCEVIQKKGGATTVYPTYVRFIAGENWWMNPPEGYTVHRWLDESATSTHLKEPEMQDEKKKHEDWEYMLKSAIYLSLIDYQDSNGHSIPCAVRGQMEDSILKKFKKSLAERDYNIARKQ